MKINIATLLILSGALLIIVELAVWTSYIFPIGTGFIISGLSFLATKSRTIATITFIISTIAGYWLSLRYSRKQKGMMGQLDRIKNQEGIVIEKIDDFTYRVRFPLGIAGEEVWIVHSEEKLSYGDKVKVTDIKGNKLIVEKQK